MMSATLVYLNVGAVLWAFWVLNNTFRIDRPPLHVAMASVVMIATWPWFAAKWLQGAWRMRG